MVDHELHLDAVAMLYSNTNIQRFIGAPILALSVTFFAVCSLSAEAQIACDTDPILVEMPICNSGRAHIFKESRSSYCGVERYNLCETQPDFVIEASIHSASGPKPIDETCSATAINYWDNLQKKYILKVPNPLTSTVTLDNQNEEIKVVSNASLDLRFNAKIDLKSDIKFSSFEDKFLWALKYSPSETVFIDGRFKTAGQRWGKYSCEIKLNFRLKGSPKLQPCGVESYNSCRHFQHEIEGSKVRKECSISEEFYSVIDSKESNSRLAKLGRVICPTLNDMHEGSNVEKESKYHELRKNYSILLEKKFIRTGLENTSQKDTYQYSKAEASEVRMKVQVLLEMARLARELKLSKDKLKEIDEKLHSKIKQFLNYSYTGTEFEELTRLFLAVKAEKSLKSLAVAYPNEVKKMREKHRAEFATLDSPTYAMLFPNGVILTQNEMRLVRENISTSSNPRATYRMAEAAIFSVSKNIRALEEKAFLLRDLEIQLYRDTMNYDELAQSLAKLFKTSPSMFQERMSKYKSDKQKLREEVVKLINLQVSSIKESINASYKNLWEIIETAEKRPHPESRIGLLRGYKALTLLDASTLKSVLRDPKIAINATEDQEVINSILLLSTSVKTSLSTLTNLRDLLSDTANQRLDMDQAIMSKIVELSKDSTSLNRTRFLSDRIWENFGGDFMQELVIQQRLQNIISEEYDKFIAVLETLPEFGKQ